MKGPTISAGDKFNRLTVTALAGRRDRKYLWTCACLCGRLTVAETSELRSGHTKSCGCLSRERTIARSTTHGNCPRGVKRPTEYVIWSSMLSRCKNPKVRCYKNYGERGISVCERWEKFENFLADMGGRPSKQFTLDRIDNERGYSPDNCRWATYSQQNKNRRPFSHKER